MPVLVPCEGCRRHIRVDHGNCPFCAAAVPAGFAKRAIPAATKRLDRLAVFTFATTIAVAACSGEVDDPGSSGTSDAGGAKDSGQVQDGGAKSDARAGDGGLVDDDGGVQALYGIPVDAGPPDDGGVQAAYGLPPDAVAPPYGLPPLDSGSD